MPIAAASAKPSRRASASASSSHGSASPAASRDPELAVELQRAPPCAFLADLERDAVALLGPLEPARQRPAAVVDRGRRKQRLGAQRRALGRRRKRRLKRPLGLGQIDPA